MTGQTTNLFAANLQSSESLMQDLAKALNALQASQVTTRKQAQKWRAPACQKAAPNHSADGGNQAIMGSLLTTFLLDGLFGMPMFSAMSEQMQGLAQLGLMAGLDHDEEEFEPGFYVPAPRKMTKSAHFDDVVYAAQQKAHMKALQEQTSQKRQLVMLKQMALMLMMQIMQQQEGETDQGGEGGLAMDPLRNPKLARFKQNRQSVSCIRTLFARQADIVMPPRVRAPQLRYA